MKECHLLPSCKRMFLNRSVTRLIVFVLRPVKREILLSRRGVGWVGNSSLSRSASCSLSLLLRHTLSFSHSHAHTHTFTQSPAAFGAFGVPHLASAYAGCQQLFSAFFTDDDDDDDDVDDVETLPLPILVHFFIPLLAGG